jgi:protein-disulfide isomerase
MASKSHGGKLVLFILVAIIGGAAGFGYFAQTANLDEKPAAETGADAAAEGSKPVVIDQALLAPKPTDIILGDANAAHTIVEYSSLSCPHCAHFHEKILPELEKEALSTGKAKLVMRYFPLNEPAVKASMVVECAGSNGLKRESFLKVLFSMQPQWAFSESYIADLKKIALVGGMDSAAFDSCMADTELENRILASRLEAAEKLGVTSTPSFFVNGAKMDGDMSIGSFKKALDDSAAKPE